MLISCKNLSNEISDFQKLKAENSNFLYKNNSQWLLSWKYIKRK